MGKMQEKLDEVMALTKALRKDYPTETNAFLSFLSKAESGKALGIREKERLLAVLSGISPETRCQCIGKSEHEE